MTRRRRSRFSRVTCPKHRTKYYPGEGCPACERERRNRNDQCQGAPALSFPIGGSCPNPQPSGCPLAPELLSGPLTVLCARAGALLSRRPRGDGRRSVSPWTAGTYTVRAPAAIRANVDQDRRSLQRRGGFPPVLVSPSRHADSTGGGQGCAGGMAGA